MSCQVCHSWNCTCGPLIPPEALAQLVTIEQRLALAVAKLRELAGKCPGCGGTGEVRELWHARILTDDARLPERGTVRAQARLRPAVEPIVRGAGWLVSPCETCRDLRQVIETAGGSL